MSDIYEQLEAWEAECDCLKNRIKQLEAENARQASAAQILADMNVSLDKENARLREAMDESYGLLCCIKTSPYRQIGAREVYIPHIDVDRVNHAIDSIKQAVERMK
jgi:uncharacterized coiled-coil protein SlyX